MNKDALVTFHNVSAGYDGRSVVANVSFEVDRSSLLALEGPNGSGKTTIVKVLLGQLAPLHGHIIRQPNLSIGYMPQILTADTDFPISVKDVVLMGQNSGSRLFPSRATRAKADDLIAFAHLSDVANSQIGQISGGQRQRTMLCRALMSNPDLLVLDEPVTYMDRSSETSLYKLLKDLKGHVGIVLVTHDAAVAASVATQTYVLGHEHQNPSTSFFH